MWAAAVAGRSRSELHAHYSDAGLHVIEETIFSRFHILVAAKE
jgi:hypothetical protein